MIAARTSLDVADNTGARRAQCIHVLGQRKRYAHIGDFIKVSIKGAQPVGMVKTGEVHNALIVRTKQAIRRPDGSFLKFDHNADIRVKYNYRSIRDAAAQEQAKSMGGEVLNIARGPGNRVPRLYPLRNILKDASNGADLYGRFLAFLRM